MDIVIWISTLIATFIITEFTAWFNHKYIMHGPLWILHKDHHKKDHKSWFERNDLFFFFYAFLSASFVVMWGQGFWLGLPIAIAAAFIVGPAAKKFVDKITKSMDPLLHLILTGGEPYLRHDLDQIVKIFYKTI